MRALRLFALLFLTALETQAHNPGLSTLQLEAEPTQLTVTLQLTPPDLDADGHASPGEFAVATALLRQHAATWVLIQDRQGPLVFTGEILEPKPADQLIVWRASAPLPTPGTLTLRVQHLGLLSSGHREFATVKQAGATTAAALLSASAPELTFTLAPPPATGAAAALADTSGTTVTPVPILSPGSLPLAAPSAPPTTAPHSFTAFIVLGIEHILTGYDHLLYLAALILGGPLLLRSGTGPERLLWRARLKVILPIITAFTLAHSLTLALATFGLVQPPSAIIEPLIAASIVCVALENLWLRGREPRLRWLAALGFGLIHGFGFAGLLTELLGGGGTSAASVLPPLVAFNIGVECGQLLVLSLVLPLLAGLARLPGWAPFGPRLASASVAVLGLFWLTERTGLL